MDKIFELDYETRSFKPTVEWMAERYNEANQKLFNGELGSCEFGLFTSGKGSLGNTNGHFRMKARDLLCSRYDRRLYKVINGEKIYVNRENFVALANPEIELNGNKLGSEWAFMVTLVHEMCHYYDYSSGIIPKQAHGGRFVRIANAITQKSGGQIEVTKKTTLERSQHFVLDGKAKQAEMNKKARATALVVYKKNEVRLIITTLEKLVYEIYNIESNRKDTLKIYRSNDPQLIETLFNSGFKSTMRSYRYWNITKNSNLINAIDNSEGKELYEAPDMGGEMLTTKRPTQTLSLNPTQQAPASPKIIFSIKTSNGVFETQCNSFSELRVQLQNRFPKMSYETISKLMGNRANFKKLEENKMDTKTIIESVIDEFMENEFRGANNDVCTIDPNMDLSEFSPLEGE